MSLQHLGPRAQHDARQARLVGLLAHCEQRFVQRQSGLDERRELTRDQGEIERADAAPELERLPSGAGCGRFHLCDLNGHELSVAEQLAHVARCVALENALVLFAVGRDGHVLIRAHQSLRVTRRTSSSVVVPANTLRIPSCRMLGPRSRA